MFFTRIRLSLRDIGANCKFRNAAVTTFYDFVSATLRSFYDRRIATPPILDCDRYFPDHVVFTDNWQKIQDECLQLMRDMGAIPHFHEVMPEQRPLSEYGKRYWRLLVLRATVSTIREIRRSVRLRPRCSSTTRPSNPWQFRF